MVIKKSKRYICLFFILFNIQAQQNIAISANNEEYYKNKIDEKPFDKKYWDKEQKKLNYNEKKEKKEEKTTKKQEKKKDDKLDFGFSPKTLQIFLYGLLFSILIIGLIYLIKSGFFSFNNKIKDNTDFNIDLFENEEIASDLHLLLEKALETKKYKLAIRIYYLLVLKSLQQNNRIVWKKYKTNRHYLNEMLEQKDYNDFEECTKIYEKIWFGFDTQISDTDFSKYQQIFSIYLSKLEKR